MALRGDARPVRIAEVLVELRWRGPGPVSAADGGRWRAVLELPGLLAQRRIELAQLLVERQRRRVGGHDVEPAVRIVDDQDVGTPASRPAVWTAQFASAALASAALRHSVNSGGVVARRQISSAYGARKYAHLRPGRHRWQAGPEWWSMSGPQLRHRRGDLDWPIGETVCR